MGEVLYGSIILAWGWAIDVQAMTSEYYIL